MSHIIAILVYENEYQKLLRIDIEIYSTVKDLMIPTPTRLKYIPILKFSSKVLLKKGKTLNQNYSDFDIVLVQRND